MNNAAYEPLISLRDQYIKLNNGKAAEFCNEMMAIIDSNPNLFILSKEEAKELTKFFLECGYISREFHQPVHLIIDRLLEFVKRAR